KVCALLLKHLLEGYTKRRTPGITPPPPKSLSLTAALFAGRVHAVVRRAVACQQSTRHYSGRQRPHLSSRIRLLLAPILASNLVLLMPVAPASSSMVLSKS